MDELDIAAETAEILNETALAAVRRRESGKPSDGICKACGETIEVERLQANPHARLCSDCAIEAEQEAVRSRRRGPG